MSRDTTPRGDVGVGENRPSVDKKNKLWELVCVFLQLPALLVSAQRCRLTPVCPTAENGICRVTQAHPEGLPNPTACSTEIQKIPPMVLYFGKDLRLRDEVSLLHFKIAGSGQRGTNAAAVVNILAIASFFAFVLLW